MMKHSKAMDKKANIVLAVIKIVYDRFPETIAETQSFINKHAARNAARKIFLLTRYFLVLIITVNFFLCYDVMLLYGLL